MDWLQNSSSSKRKLKTVKSGGGRSVCLFCATPKCCKRNVFFERVICVALSLLPCKIWNIMHKSKALIPMTILSMYCLLCCWYRRRWTCRCSTSRSFQCVQTDRLLSEGAKTEGKQSRFCQICWAITGVISFCLVTFFDLDLNHNYSGDIDSAVTSAKEAAWAVLLTRFCWRPNKFEIFALSVTCKLSQPLSGVSTIAGAVRSVNSTFSNRQKHMVNMPCLKHDRVGFSC